MNNYPDGAANDPNAPWNQKDPVMMTCDECNGEGFIDVDDYDEIVDDNCCPVCDGAGQIESEE